MLTLIGTDICIMLYNVWDLCIFLVLDKEETALHLLYGTMSEPRLFSASFSIYPAKYTIRFTKYQLMFLRNQLEQSYYTRSFECMQMKGHFIHQTDSSRAWNDILSCAYLKFPWRATKMGSNQPFSQTPLEIGAADQLLLWDSIISLFHHSYCSVN